MKKFTSPDLIHPGTPYTFRIRAIVYGDSYYALFGTVLHLREVVVSEFDGTSYRLTDNLGKDTWVHASRVEFYREPQTKEQWLEMVSLLNCRQIVAMEQGKYPGRLPAVVRQFCGLREDATLMEFLTAASVL